MSHSSENSKTAYIVSIEVLPHLLWQLELFLYSLTRNAGIDPSDIFIFWTSPSYYRDLPRSQEGLVKPEGWLSDIINCYPNINAFYCQNFGRQNRCFRFASTGFTGKSYSCINKWTSWIEWYQTGIFNQYKFITILEQDLWFYNSFPKLPDRTCASYNWIPSKRFYSNENSNQLETWGKIRGFEGSEFAGFELEDILKLVGTRGEQIDKLSQWAIIVKIDLNDITPKLLNDIVNFNYLMLHLAEIAHPNGMIYETDMVAPALAFSHNGVDVEVIRDSELLTDNWYNTDHYQDGDIKRDSIVHYGWSFKEHLHLGKSGYGVDFSKHDFGESAPWMSHESFHKLDDLIEESSYPWLKKFFGDMKAIATTYPYVRRNASRETHKIRV